MRVLHVDTAAGWRGGQNQVLLTARGMAARGHEVALACLEGGALEARARADGITVRPLRFRGDLSPGAILGLRRIVREMRPDVVQLHDPHALAAGILATHGEDGPRTVATRRVDFRVRGPLSRWKYRSCHRIIAASRAIAKVLEEAGVPAARLRLVYEGVPDRPAQQGGAEALRELGVPPGSPVVGNVAALADHKDHATLLAAASRVVPRLPDVRFVIVGEGERRRALETLARSLGLGERCIFAGFRRDLDRLIPAFSVFCLSSHMEGLGTSLLDAMTFCVPIVATAAGGIPEVVEDGVTGFLVPIRDPVALAEALFQVLADPKRRSQMASAGRQRYERLFTAERMVDETIGVFEELLRPS